MYSRKKPVYSPTNSECESRIKHHCVTWHNTAFWLAPNQLPAIWLAVRTAKLHVSFPSIQWDTCIWSRHHDDMTHMGVTKTRRLVNGRVTWLRCITFPDKITQENGNMRCCATDCTGYLPLFVTFYKQTPDFWEICRIPAHFVKNFQRCGTLNFIQISYHFTVKHSITFQFSC